MKARFLFFAVAGCAIAATVATVNYDSNRTNANTSETLLTPSRVAAGKFGKFGSWNTDGYVMAQPLYVPNVLISTAYKNLLIVVTLHNSVYAFDADNPGTTIWSNLAFATTNTSYPGFGQSLYSQGIGCLSTPVADVANSKLYVVCDNNTPNWILRELDLTSGSTLKSATISGQVTGTGDLVDGGDTTSGSNLLFYPAFEFQRAGLGLANGNVYIGFAANTDVAPWHGWLMAYRTSDFAQVGIWNATPNGVGGGIWQAGGAPAFDASGNVYVTTGNGTTYDGASNFTNSVLKFSPTLTLLDWFEPSNNAAIDSADADTSSNRVLLIPGTSFAVVAAKDFNVYLIDTGCMGHLQASGNPCSLQTFKTNGAGSPNSGSGSYGLAFMNNLLFLPTTAGSIYAFTWGGSNFTTTPAATQTNTYGFPGPAQMAGSCNGSSNCILWVITSSTNAFSSPQNGTLRALNPSDLSEYWNSGTNANDALGKMAKFMAPTIADGKVFVATLDNKVMAYGLIPSTTLTGNATLTGGATIH